YGYFSVVYHYAHRTQPIGMKNLDDLLRYRLKAAPAGFAVLRGVLFGASYLLGHISLLWLLGTFRLGAADAIWLNFVTSQFNDQGNFVVFLPAMVIVTILLSWMAIALPIS